MRLPFLPSAEDATSPEAERFARQLEARAGRAFAPDPAALRRVRARAAAEFRLRHEPGAPDPARRWRWFAPMRPAAALALALGLLAGSFGLAAANSGPGQPFYGLRLAAEELTLPPPGPARLRAQLARLADRLAEARQGAQAHDPAAVAAALAAYRDELTSALTQAAASGGDGGTILDALATHQAVLDGLASSLPAAAGSGVEQALDQVQRVADQLRAGPSASPSPAATEVIPSGAPARSAIPSAEPTAPVITLPPAASHRPWHSPGLP